MWHNPSHSRWVFNGKTWSNAWVPAVYFTIFRVWSQLLLNIPPERGDMHTHMVEMGASAFDMDPPHLDTSNSHLMFGDDPHLMWEPTTIATFPTLVTKLTGQLEIGGLWTSTPGLGPEDSASTKGYVANFSAMLALGQDSSWTSNGPLVTVHRDGNGLPLS